MNVINEVKTRTRTICLFADMNCNVFCKCIPLYQIAKTVEGTLMRPFICLYTFSTGFISCPLTSGAFQKTQSICLALKSQEAKENYFTKNPSTCQLALNSIDRTIINPIFRHGDANIRSSKSLQAHVVKLGQIHLFDHCQRH